ncbi:MAG: AtpZ/AtpI family protein [Deltaproteobacteria bacterium]|nr:AtpZ/AtpI family protein [Deltaproteobacteria bacterium]
MARKDKGKDSEKHPAGGERGRESGSEKAARHMAREVAVKQEKKERRREQGEESVWFGLGMLGLVGWSVAIPTVIGVAIGIWLDKKYPAVPISFTLTLLFVGVAAGCVNAWYWVQRESRK